jgi:hypothetical protein
MLTPRYRLPVGASAREGYMPYMEKSLRYATNMFAPLEQFEPKGLLDALAGVDNLLDGATRMGIFETLDDPAYAEALRKHFAKLPPSIGASILAGLRSALERGLHTQFIWKPAYDFELTMWEVSADGKAPGTLTFQILSPHPDEPPPSKG